jgi:hypothetical protein
MFDEAINHYNLVLRGDARNFNVMTALAYTYHLKGEYMKALDIYHKVNFIRSNDVFVAEMINKCLNDLVEN